MKPELRRSARAGVIAPLYSLSFCRRHWRCAHALLKAVLAAEGGEFFSATARELLSRWHGISIGAYSYGACFHLDNYPEGVTVGRYCSIGRGTALNPPNHPIDRLSTHPFFFDPALGIAPADGTAPAALVIDHDVWIGARVIIAPGCRRIGTGAVIGAGSVVTSDVAPYVVVAGNPARVIKNRFQPATIDALLESRWWERPLGDVLQHLPHMFAALEPDPFRHPLVRTDPQRCGAPPGFGASPP